MAQFAERNNDNNVMVRQLAGKTVRDKVTEKDLELAIMTMQQRFIVGLTDQMEESIHRFNIVLGINEEEESNKRCMDQYFGDNMEKKNSNPHRKERKGSKAWRIFAEKNSLDMQLYDVIVKLFEEQKEIIDSYGNVTRREASG